MRDRIDQPIHPFRPIVPRGEGRASENLFRRGRPTRELFEQFE